MRRIIWALLFAAASVGFMALPAGADASTTNNSQDPNIILAFDFSDNSVAAAVSNGPFNIITDVLTLDGSTAGGVVRMIAVAPANSGEPNLKCDYQSVQQGEVECAFNFTTSGVWQVRTEWSDNSKDAVLSYSVTDLRVGN